MLLPSYVAVSIIIVNVEYGRVMETLWGFLKAGEASKDLGTGFLIIAGRVAEQISSLQPIIA